MNFIKVYFVKFGRLHITFLGAHKTCLINVSYFAFRGGCFCFNGGDFLF